MSSGITYPRLEQRPGAGGALEREAAADRAPDHHGLLLARRPHELDEPAMEDSVDVDVLRLRAELVHVLERDRGLQGIERVR